MVGGRSDRSCRTASVADRSRSLASLHWRVLCSYQTQWLYRAKDVVLSMRPPCQGAVVPTGGPAFTWRPSGTGRQALCRQGDRRDDAVLEHSCNATAFLIRISVFAGAC